MDPPFLDQLGLTSGSVAEMWEVQELEMRKNGLEKSKTGSQRNREREMYSLNRRKESPSKSEDEVVHKQAIQIHRLHRAYHFVVGIPLNCFLKEK